jgi:hypothetical protein
MLSRAGVAERALPGPSPDAGGCRVVHWQLAGGSLADGLCLRVLVQRFLTFVRRWLQSKTETDLPVSTLSPS